MDNVTVSLIVGAAAGSLATLRIPARQHDARGLAVLAGLTGSVLGGGLLALAGAPSPAQWLAAVAGAMLATSLLVARATRASKGTENPEPPNRRVHEINGHQMAMPRAMNGTGRLHGSRTERISSP